ncbi:glycosyl transferase [Chitinophaga sp. SYP-B3965]|uniref:glycosyl transferase n=1 Tax=Chitinophaga sp. SYP-B3965 TaxID=2663120 RepID=UPI001299C49B|nr:glycosyl transferase [Chitinophaga sp. SYP-B3965]MRG46981.1 glycosyl transferase [Chitinophaga sp. SYP-B3965]
MTNIDDYEGIVIPTYVINLSSRTDRLEHIQRQFNGRKEFDLLIVDACRHEIGAVGLWQSIVKIIKDASTKEDEVIIICEDDHEFTADYCSHFLMKNIIEAHQQGVKLLSGGIGGFNQTVPITPNRCWIDTFWSTQFMVIYRGFFQTILNEPFEDGDTADGKFSEMTSNKMVLFPFISIQKDFGYSDVTVTNNVMNGEVTRLFRDTSARLSAIMNVYNRYNINVSY